MRKRSASIESALLPQSQVMRCGWVSRKQASRRYIWKHRARCYVMAESKRKRCGVESRKGLLVCGAVAACAVLIESPHGRHEDFAGVRKSVSASFSRD
jgi:hypothetical protein